MGFDPRGNRTSQSDSIGGSSLAYGYDQANRLISLTGASSASYSYNGDGWRSSKTVGGTTTALTWDVAAGLPLLLADGNASYIYSPEGQILEQIQSKHPILLPHRPSGQHAGTYGSYRRDSCRLRLRYLWCQHSQHEHCYKCT